MATLGRHESKTRLLDAALKVIRTKGYAAATVDDICEAAGVSKGSFFHHFASKEALALGAAAHFAAMADALFATAPYRGEMDARERLLGYVDLRAQLLRGDLPDFTCLLGTMVQETYATHPAIREACNKHIGDHASAVARDVADAKRRYAPNAPWTAESLGLFTQAVIQGAFILAKAGKSSNVAADCLGHLRRYLESQFPLPSKPTAQSPESTNEGTSNMTLSPNLFFSGNAEEVLEHYRAALGGEVEFVRFAGTPAAEFTPPEWSSKVLYGALRSPFGVVNAMDAPPGRESTPGDNFAISVPVDNEDRAAEIFATLASGGHVLMPFEQTFFAKKFGMLTDRFGVKWMVNVAAEAR